MVSRRWTFNIKSYLLTMLDEPIVPIVKNYPKPTETIWARMRYWLQMFFIFHFSFFIFQSCGLDVEDPTPPSPPIWVEKSLPEEWPERGIDAHESGGIFLEWEAKPDEDIAAYHIFRARYFESNDSLGEFSKRARVENESTTNLSYIDQGIIIGSRYYYKLKSEDGANNLSAYSESVTYLLFSAIDASLMIPNGLADTLLQNSKLSWKYSFSLEMEEYSITVLDAQDELVIRAIFSPGNYVSEREYWQFPPGLILDSGQVYKWRIDTNARYIEDRESSGSESHWASFRF